MRVTSLDLQILVNHQFGRKQDDPIWKDFNEILDCSDVRIALTILREMIDIAYGRSHLPNPQIRKMMFSKRLFNSIRAIFDIYVNLQGCSTHPKKHSEKSLHGKRNRDLVETFSNRPWTAPLQAVGSKWVRPEMDLPKTIHDVNRHMEIEMWASLRSFWFSAHFWASLLEVVLEPRIYLGYYPLTNHYGFITYNPKLSHL